MTLIKYIGRRLRKHCPYLYRKALFFYYKPELRRRILRDVKLHPEAYDTPELLQAADYIRRNPVTVFPHAFGEKYGSLPVEVREDEGMAYTVHNGRRLYFPFPDNPEKVARIYRSLLLEQDRESPHCYTADGFGIGEGAVLFDIGSAEGIFALDNVERASRVILFESDPSWTRALRKTFEPWKDKVMIVNKFVSDRDGADSVSVDSVVREYGIDAPVFLKIDVEGAEERVLKGAAATLAHKDTKAVVCTYHRHGDHGLLSEIMTYHGFDVRSSRGYMLFVYDEGLKPPFFRRGVIYCTKPVLQ